MHLTLWTHVYIVIGNIIEGSHRNLLNWFNNKQIRISMWKFEVGRWERITKNILCNPDTHNLKWPLQVDLAFSSVLGRSRILEHETLCVPWWRVLLWGLGQRYVSCWSSLSHPYCSKLQDSASLSSCCLYSKHVSGN